MRSFFAKKHRRGDFNNEDERLPTRWDTTFKGSPERLTKGDWILRYNCT